MPSAGVYAFEAIDETLPFIPLAGRRALDALGRKLSLQGWLSLSVDDRRLLVIAGASAVVDPRAASAVDRASPVAAAIGVVPEPDASSPPPALVASLGGSRPLGAPAWAALSPLDRFALAKSAKSADKLARAYDEIVAPARLTHVDAAGAARMVDVAAKEATWRRATASGCVRTTTAVIEAVMRGGVAKGDVLAVARVAGILAAKRTPELIPLCHPVQTTSASVDFEADAAKGELRVRATVEAVDRTGVEMEAMVAATIACLTAYDMIKSADRWATIDAVRLDAKSGGKSGPVERPPERGGE